MVENRVKNDMLVENKAEVDKLEKNLVYARRLEVIPESTRVQEFDQSRSTNVTNSDF